MAHLPLGNGFHSHQAWLEGATDVFLLPFISVTAFQSST